MEMAGSMWDLDLTQPESFSNPNHQTLKGINILTSLPADALCALPHCAGSPIDMCPPIHPSECEQCVMECNIENCGTEEQCTDRCVVVPCDHPCIDSCGVCPTSSDTLCESGRCQGFEELISLLPKTSHNQPTHSTQFESCVGLRYSDSSHSNPHNHMTMSENQDRSPYPDWSNATLSKELDALICACHGQSLPHSFDCNSCDPSLLTVNKSHPFPSHRPSIPHSGSNPMSSPGSPASARLSPMPTSTSSSRSTPDPSPGFTIVPHSSGRVGAPEHISQTSFEPREQYRSEVLFCLWADCGKGFSSSQDLITHVNIAHLDLPLVYGGFSTQNLPPQQPQVSSSRDERVTLQDQNLLYCMWDNCNRYPTLSQVPGPSTGNIIDAAKGLLASHVQQDHLGILVHSHSDAKHSGTSSLSFGREPMFADMSSQIPPSASNISATLSNSTPTSSDSQDVRSASPISQCFCKWQSCPQRDVPFGSAADLTTHITNDHVGVGNSRYHCLWEGCNRNGDAGFSSKQKILRHVQSHTGHRPFQCKICNQYFSEAATLQQHMRRHTKEKPYVCDHPGCNKAFAITGALTIHRRVHSGNKPFKCTYCGRSFSESSNLSKHIRTHTGDRPYACLHPGCEKRFARPDQVARHMNVHNKKKATVAGVKNATVDIED